MQGGEVRTGARLGVSLAPVVLARQDPRQVVRLLFLRAVPHDYRADHLQPHGRKRWRPSPGTFRCEDVALHFAPSRTAVSDRPGRGDPTPAVQNPLPGEAVGLVHEDTGGALSGTPQLRRKVRLQEGADLPPKVQVLAGQVEMHSESSGPGSFCRRRPCVNQGPEDQAVRWSSCLTRSARVLMSMGLARKDTLVSPSSRLENSASA